MKKSNPNLPKNLKPVFIDELDLIGKGTLKTALQDNLRRSNYLIVICSPSSAKSPYVNDEVQYFIDSGRTDHIIPLIVDGVPHSPDPDKECFTPAILGLPFENELLGIDLQKFGMRDTFLRIIATMLQLDLDNFLSREAKQRKRRAVIFALLFSAAVIIAVILMPPPYDEFYAENVMERAMIAYSRAGQLHAYLNSLTDTAANNPKDFSMRFLHYKQTQEYLLSAADSGQSLQYLATMMETGKVMPWSRKPMSRQECEELLTLPDKRKEEYMRLADVLAFAMTDDFAQRYYLSKYIELLRGLLETDAEISAALYEIVCAPHMAGKFADESVTAQEIMSTFSYTSKQNEYIKGEGVRQAKETLASLKGKRDEQIRAIDSCGIFAAYNQKNNSEE